MFSWIPSKYYLKALFRPGRQRKSLEDIAVNAVEIAPPIKRRNRAAIMLPGILERITGYCFGTDKEFESIRLSGEIVEHGATCAYQLNKAVLLDGNLFSAGEIFPQLNKRKHHLFNNINVENSESALTSSFLGSIYFGHWFLDDCVRYLIANQFGQVVAPITKKHLHQPEYEQRLAMQVHDCDAIQFNNLWLFDDRGQNDLKRERYNILRTRLLNSVNIPSPVMHEGVYIIRALNGVRRLLTNESEVAERFRRRGFRIIDPELMSAEEIIRALAGAKIAAGVEGSALSHAVALMAPNTTLLVINPPNRFNSVFKDMADCKEIYYAVMVGIANGEDFSLKLDELEKTLDLISLRVTANNTADSRLVLN